MKKVIPFGLITYAGCVSCSIVAHYAEVWALSFLLAFIFAAFGAVAVAVGEEP